MTFVWFFWLVWWVVLCGVCLFMVFLGGGGSLILVVWFCLLVWCFGGCCCCCGWCLVLVFFFFFLPADDKRTLVELCPTLFPPGRFLSFNSVSSLYRVDSGGWTWSHMLVSLDIQMPAPLMRKLLQLYVQCNILLWWAYRHVTRDRAWGMHLNGTGFAYRLCFTLMIFFSLIRGGHI